MKYIILLTIGLSFIFNCKTGSCNDQKVTTPNAPENTPDDTLSIISTPELYSLTRILTTEYMRQNPTLNIAISDATENQTLKNSNLRFISNVSYIDVNDEAGWSMVIGHDAIVPVINANNPMLSKITGQGISAEEFARLSTDSEKLNWATLINGGQNRSVSYYVVDNEIVLTGIANFTKTSPASFNGIKLATAEELVSAVQKDFYAVGVCKLADLIKTFSNEMPENIKLLPIDKNGNGRIDNFENIYDNPKTFLRGVWIGKYPKTLCGSIYAVASAKPTDKNTLAFLTWLLGEGGQFLNQNGYTNLARIERESNLNALLGYEIHAPQTSDSRGSFFWLLMLSGLVITGLLFTVVIFNLVKVKKEADIGDISITTALNESVIAAPKGLYFDRSHTWAFMEQDGIVKVGIDDFLQHITGTITRIKMKKPGERVRKGEKILTIIRDGKQLNINAPVSGIIKEQNHLLITDSSIINSSPYSEGWVYTIEPKNWLRETEFLLMSEKYKEWLKNEFGRLKDFFATSSRSNSDVYAQIILQDGGQLTDKVLADLGPEVWEDFQTNFIDTSR